MSALTFELRQVARASVRRPAFFAVATLTLAIGFAAYLSAFSLVDRLLLASPPHVADAGRVFRLHLDWNFRGGRFLAFQTPYPSFEALRSGTQAFEAMAGYRPTTASVGTGADARELALVFADHQYFPLLGVGAHIGRTFTAEENRPPSGAPVLVISDAYWRSAFAADPAAVGRTLRIGPTTFTIIGVMPAGFTGDAPDRVDAWAPLFAGAYELPSGWMTSLSYRSVTVVVRLAQGITQAAASERAARVYRRFVENTEMADPTALAVLAPLEPGRTQRGDLNAFGRLALWIHVVAALVLLVAVANVVNLHLSRVAQRRREQAVRVALGAGRFRVLGPIALEILLITLTAASAGSLLMYWLSGALQQLFVPGAPVNIAWERLVPVIAGAGVLTTMLVVGTSALHLRMHGVADRLKTGRGGDGFSRDRLRQALLVAQVSGATVLLVGAGLFLSSVQRLARIQFGHDQERVLVVTTPMRAAGYDAAAIDRFFDRALRELPAVPGVERVAAAQSTPFAPSQSANLTLPGADRFPLPADRFPTFYTVTPDFFRTMGMRVLRGRGFDETDRASSAPVMVLEEALAQALWPGGDALGKCLIVGPPTSACREIVGIVSNTRRFVADGRGSLRYYLPLAQRYVPIPPQALFVRGDDPAALAASVRSALLAIDAGLPYVRTRTLYEMAEPDKRPWRLGSVLFVLFGVAALLVSSTGVYALLSFMVAQRSREIGVRLALGASPALTLRLIVRQSVGWAIGGLAAGVAVALAAGRFVRPMLFETSPYEPTVFASTVAVLVGVAVVASLAPAIRASRVDPNIALRAE